MSDKVWCVILMVVMPILPMWNSDEMIIGKMHPTLEFHFVRIYRFV